MSLLDDLDQDEAGYASAGDHSATRGLLEEAEDASDEFVDSSGKTSSFWKSFLQRRSRRSTDNMLMLTPALDHPSRTGTRSSAIFNLIATMVGGGVLSLPYALAKAGVVLGLVYLLIAAGLSAYSIRLLLSCSRRSGATSYEEVALKAFGRKAQMLTMVLVILLTYLAIVAYLILARDLASPLVESYVVGKKLDAGERNLIAYVVIVMISPVCLANSVQSLKFTSLASIVALLVLTLSIMYRCIEWMEIRKTSNSSASVVYISTSVEDSIYAFPFMQVAFLCHFNVLPMHTGLRKPTKKRLDFVVNCTIMTASVIYIAVAVAGYYYAYDHVCDKDSSSSCVDGVADNILNVFDVRDLLINAGRVGLFGTICLSLPLLVLPCRQTLMRLFKADDDAETVPVERSGRDILPTVVDDIGYQAMDDTPGGERLGVITSDPSPEFRTAQIRRMRRQVYRLRDAQVSFQKLCSSDGAKNAFVTFLILCTAAMIMTIVPGIGLIWNLTGSTVSIILAFILPSSFYLKLRSGGRIRCSDSRLVSAWALLILSCCTFVVCSVQSLMSIVKG